MPDLIRTCSKGMPKGHGGTTSIHKIQHGLHTGPHLLCQCSSMHGQHPYRGFLLFNSCWLKQAISVPTSIHMRVACLILTVTV